MMKLYRPDGWLSVLDIHDAEGKRVPLEKAARYGWIQPSISGPNLFTDDGRQLLANIFGGRPPVGDFICSQFGVGVGTTPPTVSDVALESPLSFYAGSSLKPIDSVTWPAPFIAQVQFTLAATEANGYLLTEMGLFSGNDTLIARRVHVGINKTSDFAPTLGWRIRF